MADSRPTFWIRREGENTNLSQARWHWILEDAEGHIVTEGARQHPSTESCIRSIRSLQALAAGAAIRAEHFWDEWGMEIAEAERNQETRTPAEEC